MQSENREIQKRDVDWLWRAVAINDIQKIYIGEEAAMATDGYRFHAINSGKLPSSVNGIDVQMFLDHETSVVGFKKEIRINPKYLLDALSGFVPSETGMVVLRVVGNGSIWSVEITDDTSNRFALVACVRGDSDESD